MLQPWESSGRAEVASTRMVRWHEPTRTAGRSRPDAWCVRAIPEPARVSIGGWTAAMTETDTIRELLSTGRPRELTALLASIESGQRRKACKPLVRQADAILSVSLSSTVTSWLRDLREDYPGGHEQFVDAWNGRLTDGHWDAATTVLLASKAAPQAAKVWPIPSDAEFAHRVYPALFPNELTTFVERWSADFAAGPKNWDRNRGRAVMYEWVESGLVDAPRHNGGVLMLISGWASRPGESLLRWLLERPKVTSEIFARIFSTPGVKGASLAQSDDGYTNGPLRTVVVPGLMAAGVWSQDFVAQGVESALKSDLPAYQRRWFVRLAADLGL
jgi:hypothetical protein